MVVMGEVTKKRVFVGGLFDGITDTDLKERFQRFGMVTSVDVKTKAGHQGCGTDKTFAYLDLDISDTNYKKCLATFNNTKWKGGIVTVQPAKDHFIKRLNEERKANKEEQQVLQRVEHEAESTETSPHPRVEIRHKNFKTAGVEDYHLEKAVPGTPISGERKWVVGKYGRVLPIVYIRRPDKKKVMKVDPSKHVHHLKVMKENDDIKMETKRVRDKSVSNLTWNVPEVTTDDYKKRKGIFPQVKTGHPRKTISKAAVGHFDSNYSDKVLKTDKSTPDDVFGARTIVPRAENRQILDKNVTLPPKTNVQTSKSRTKFEDFEVVQVEDVKRAIPSYSAHLIDLNRKRTPLKADSRREKDKGAFTKMEYDSDGDSDCSADTDEICTFVNQSTAKNKTYVASDNSKDYDSNDTDEIIAMSKSRTLSGDDSKTPSSHAILKSSAIGNDRLGDVRDSSNADLNGDRVSRDGHELDEQSAQPKLGLDIDHVLNKTSATAPIKHDNKSPNDSNSFQSSSSSKAGQAPKITKSNMASLMGEVSSESEKSDEDDDDEHESSGDGTGSDAARDEDAQLVKKKATSSDLEESEESEEGDDEDDDESGSSADDASSDAAMEEDAQLLMQKMTEANTALRTGDTSSESEESEDSYDDDDDDSEDTDDSDEAGSVIYDDSKVERTQLHMPKITKVNLASLMGQKSSSENDDSDNESPDSKGHQDVVQNHQAINAILSDKLKYDSPESIRTSPKLAAKVIKKPVINNATIAQKKKESKKERNSKKQSSQKESMSDSSKKLLSNEARLESVKRRQAEMSKQQALIHGALASVDSKDTNKSPGKHFRFDSDDSGSEGDDEEDDAVDKQLLKEKNNASSKTGIHLFDSGDDDDEEEVTFKMKEDDFASKPEFEGKSGAKLMRLQSRFGGDDRFQLDKRFLDAPDKTITADEKDAEENVDDQDLKEERQKSLAILEKIVGSRAMAKNKSMHDPRYAFKDLSTLRYDPSKDEHVKFEQKDPESETEESTAKREEAPLPDVSKERFYETSNSLKDAFSGSVAVMENEEKSDNNKPFTFFTAEEEDDSTDISIGETAKATPLSSVDLMWKAKTFKFDSSDSESDNDEANTMAMLKKRSAEQINKDKEENETDQPVPKKFFFQEDDVRLKDSPLWFFNVPKAGYREEKMNEKKEELKAGFRTRHKRAVRTWNRKKMEKQQQKPRR